MKPTDDELEAMAVRGDTYIKDEEKADRLVAEKVAERPMGPIIFAKGELPESEAADQLIRDMAAMLRACKSGDAACGDWLVDESEHGTLIYRLKEDGWRKGVPVMVNDVTIRIENSNRSDNDLHPITARILAALDPAPDHAEWNAALEDAAKVCEEEAQYKAKQIEDTATTDRDQILRWTAGKVQAKSLAKKIREREKGPRHD